MYSVYVLLSKKDNNFYIGFTNNLKTRLENHQKGKVNSTMSRRPLKLIYYEACLHRFDALKREKYLKSGPGRKYLKNRLKNSERNIPEFHSGLR